MSEELINPYRINNLKPIPHKILRNFKLHPNWSVISRNGNEIFYCDDCKKKEFLENGNV